MTVEIGSLVVRASFGAPAGSDDAQARLRDEVARLRQDLLDEMQDMIAEAERRTRER